MIFRVFLLIFFLLNALTGHSQAIISQFGWNGGPVTNADVGPNATSVSGSAVSDVSGTSGTNGLNAGLPKANIQMVIPGSPTFDVNGIDVSFDYQREESFGTFWQRGSSVVISGCNQFSVSYRVENGAGGYTTVSSGNVYNIPNDDTFRRYRFIYEPTTGFGYAMVNGAVVWSNDGPDNRNLYWVGAGNVVVGSGMDGTGFNDTFLDSLVVATVVNSALPIELLKFEVNKTTSNEVKTTWSTSSERNNDYFLLQRTQNGLNWEEVTKVKGAGNSSSQINYEYIDPNPFSGVSYYRLTQVDFDGKAETFDVKSVLIPNDIGDVFPNPFSRYCFLNIEGDECSVISIDGSDVTEMVSKSLFDGLMKLDFEQCAPGVYFVGNKISRQRVVKH